MDNTISRAEHEEFARRLDEHNRRQDRRIELLETSVSRFGQIATSVEKLALNMEGMVKEQQHQGERLAQLEARPGKRWDTLIKTIITALASGLVGAALTALIK